MEGNKIFETLSNVDVSGLIDKKNNLDYLSWATAIKEVKKIYPDMSYNIIFFDGKPYLYDENLGYMVFTQVKIENQSIDMWLPVMDSSNKAMKKEPYTYKTKWGSGTVEAATFFDINKALMRCLAKNIAMFGLGISLYAGEDLPDDLSESKPKEVKKEIKKEEPKETFSCSQCGKEITDFNDGKKILSAKFMYNLSIDKFGKGLCMDCIKSNENEAKND